MRGDLDAEIIRLRAWWDQAQAMVRDAEAAEGPLIGCRILLAEARELIDFAAECEDAR